MIPRATLQSLEYAEVLSLIAGYCRTVRAAELISALTPSIDRASIEHDLDIVQEMVSFRTSYGSLSLDGIVDIRQNLLTAQPKGSVLEPAALLAITFLLNRVQRLCDQFKPVKEDFPLLDELIQAFDPLPQIISLMERSLGADGEILDDASPELKKIRNKIYRTREKIYAKLDEFMARTDVQPSIQDHLITQRNQRFVIPVRIDGKSRVDGIIHDQSASGATLFIEPMGVLPLNNQLLQDRLAEEREIQQILRRLTDLIRTHSDAIMTDFDVMTAMDVIQAKAFFAMAFRTSRPRVVDGSTFEIFRGRHPLLMHYLGEEHVIPLTILVHPDHRVLLISGPNMGGKTVTLKTAGLLALMVQTGIPVPASPDSVFPIFRSVFTDIGDQQNLSQSLSTFASHLLRLRDILERAGEDSLVLIDELGTGTDPDEGGALGMMVLDEMIERRAWSIVTTHLTQLKQQMLKQTDKMVASVIFDRETGKPTFELNYGQYGESNAFAIASNLGMSEKFVEKAKQFLNPLQVRLAELQETLDQRLSALTTQEAELHQTREQLSQERRDMIHEQEGIKREIRDEGNRLLSQVRDRIRFLHRELSKPRIEPTVLKQTEEIVSEIEELLELPAELEPETPSEPLPDTVQTIDAPLRIGQSVFIPSFNRNGVIEDLMLERKTIVVSSAGMKFKLREDQIQVVRDKHREKEETIVSFESAEQSKQVPTHLSLRGERVDFALDRLDKYLDDASIAGLPRVYVIHGIGEERLRPAIRDFLKDHPHVASFRNGDKMEGGYGVTVVDLAAS